MSAGLVRATQALERQIKEIESELAEVKARLNRLESEKANTRRGRPKFIEGEGAKVETDA